MTRLAIVGAGGHGKVAGEIAELNGYTEIHFYDDRADIEYPWKIMGAVSDLYQNVCNYDGVFVAIGSNSTREAISRELMSRGALIVSLVHPSAIVSPRVKLGVGVLIVGGAVINSAAEIKDGSIVNTGATIGHDCRVGAYSHIAPGCNLAGETIIGSNVWIGIGSVLIQQLTVTDNVYLGAGSLVVSDITESGLYFGNPVKRKNKI